MPPEFNVRPRRESFEPSHGRLVVSDPLGCHGLIGCPTRTRIPHAATLTTNPFSRGYTYLPRKQNLVQGQAQRSKKQLQTIVGNGKGFGCQFAQKLTSPTSRCGLQRAASSNDGRVRLDIAIIRHFNRIRFAAEASKLE